MWGGTHTGTVVRRDGRSVFVAWHHSFVEDELHVDQVEIWADAPEELRRWSGGDRGVRSGRDQPDLFNSPTPLTT
ncbi:MAG: hypothetical protein M0007_01750 [Actinomycetota bacterium]|nr:hypothetical protein [Actinomycetota bacterium]